MPDFIRRMLDGAAMLRSPPDDGGAAAGAAGDAGGDQGGTNAPNPVDAATGDAETPPQGDGSPPPATPSGEAPPDRTQQRMNTLVAERWAERRRAEAAEQQSRLLQEQLNQTRAALQPPAVDADGNPTAPTAPAARPPVVPLSADEIQRQAQAIADQNAFNAQVAAEVQRGRDPTKGGFQDFDQVAANLQRFGELPRTFVEAALATGKGAEVIYHLGKDITEADRILSLPPMQQAVALAQFAGAIKAPEAPKIVSSAPAPVAPRVGGGAKVTTPSLEDENMPIGDWIALREKGLQKNAARR